ncbi:MAG: bacterial transcriptional activator domain-containing protein [Ktedonobacteraceae bacterium]
MARARRGGLLAQARLYQQRGGLRRGEALLSNIVEENAFDEDALCALMLNLHQQGRTSEGLRLYEETKALLEREGLAPTETTRATAQQVRRAFSLVGEHQRATLLPSLSDSLPEDQQARTPESFIPTTPLISDASMHHVLTLPISLTEPQPSSEIMVPDFTTQFGVMCAQILTLVQQWYGMARFYHALQDHVDQHIKKLDMLKSLSSLETYTLSRRSFLTTLAALPATCLASRKQVHIMSLDVEELLPQCAASITSCWHLSGGSHLNAIGPIIDSYVPTLVAIMKNAPSYREVAADLVAQCYFLKAILAWHVQGLTLAETYCLQALHYSDIAQNINLRLTALNQHALISYYAKQFPKALAKSEEASAILQRTSQEHIFPIVQGRVFMYLAAFQAQQQSSADAEHTLEQARHAFDLQATLAEPVPLYADCGNASLTLWEGLAQYHLSLHDATHAERALLSLRTFGRLQSDMEIPERFRLECLINRILAASQCNEMEEAIDCFEAANQGSKALESKQRSAEVESAFRDMLRHWPKEKQVQHVGAFLYAKE